MSNNETPKAKARFYWFDGEICGNQSQKKWFIIEANSLPEARVIFVNTTMREFRDRPNRVCLRSSNHDWFAQNGKPDERCTRDIGLRAFLWFCATCGVGWRNKGNVWFHVPLFRETAEISDEMITKELNLEPGSKKGVKIVTLAPLAPRPLKMPKITRVGRKH